jgi:hypothetical protein
MRPLDRSLLFSKFVIEQSTASVLRDDQREEGMTVEFAIEVVVAERSRIEVRMALAGETNSTHRNVKLFYNV